MTKTARKSLANKLILFTTAILLIVVIALQLAYAPAFSVAPNKNGSHFVDKNGLGDVSVSYKDADNGLVPDEYRRSDGTIASAASTGSTPAPDDNVSVIINLSGKPMIEYAASNGITVADALKTSDGKRNFSDLGKIRDLAYSGISDYIIEYRYNYSTVMNGFSATVRYGDIEAIRKNKYVESVIISNTYLAPQTVTENYVDVYETGIFNSSGIGYDGTGTVVAVLDTGTDYTHEVFDMELDHDTLAMTQDDVAAVVPLLTATSLSAAQGDSIDEDDLYLTSKLPFAYDYADSDTNVYPREAHGTHVAGIIAGKSDTITGVATGAQIATFKVFSDYKTGAETEAILAALNDAVTLGVDAINMSLGSSCGFSREVDEEEINKVYDRINDAGICLVVAASNDGSSAQSSTWGNTNLSSNPDSGTVGSPGSYTASLAVGSVSGVKTKYFMVDGHEIYFAESRLVGKTDPNDFVGGLLGEKSEGEYEYVVIPGVGLSVNYSGIDVTGKIAVVRRGTTNFEEKVRVAADKGAAGVIVYNNVSGTIGMSVGTKEIIPSCFVTMDIAEPIVASGKGTLKLSTSYLAGPFMSDFSSWGALPDLTLAPDITAHGGEIKSAVPGGNTYDKLSGTSMASPNLAGALILVRQYVKERHANDAVDTKLIRDESYSRMMSTATMVRNEEGNPYSPRKQGAGIADIAHSINTNAYITVDGSNKPKLSLGDDPMRTGDYTLKFNVVNVSKSALSYNVNPYVMTESMSSDGRTVAEKAYMFDDTVNTYNAVATKGKVSLKGATLSLGGFAEAEVTVTISLSKADKEYLDKNFMNGMFVEGYVRLESNNLDAIDLSIPYMGFYGDWTDAPMLDVTEYAVGESAVDDSILPEDKLVADVFGTLPYSGFASSSSDDGIGYWGMGSFSFIPATGYATPAAQEKYAALTSNPDGDYLFYMVRAGLLRGAKRVDMEIRNSTTGELIWSGVDYNARKTHSSGGQQTGGLVLIELDISKLNLPNNSKYTFNMSCYLDWQDSNGEYTYGNKNTFSFEFTVDNEAPEFSDVALREEKAGGSKRQYLDLTMYDNHYIQGIALYTYEGKDKNGNLTGIKSLYSGVVPVASEFNKDTTFSFDVSSYWSYIQANGGKLYVTAYDYAKNGRSIEIVVEQETDLRIEKTRSAKDEYSVVPNGQIDLSEYIIVTANALDNVDEEDKAYIENYWTKDLIWESSDPSIVEVDRNSGLITGIKQGTATVTVRTPDKESFDALDKLHCLQFKISVAGTPTTISMSGIEMYVCKTDDSGNVVGEYRADSLALERGETAVISAKIKPYNYKGEYTLNWTSTSSNVKIQDVSSDGLTVKIMAAESGSATVRATVSGSRISGYTSIRVKEEFNIYESVYLRSYTGRGGDYVNENGEVEHNVVDIPDDKGIVYIYPGAFRGNTHIKKVIIPQGVTTIMREAFQYCLSLEEVVLPESVETLEKNAFTYCPKLKKINLENVKTIGDKAFIYNTELQEIDLSSCTYIDKFAFAHCESLTSLDLSNVGTVGGGAFTYCNSLETLDIPENLSMGWDSPYIDGGAFGYCSNLKSVTIRSKTVGDYAFANCESLRSVTFMNDVSEIGACAFIKCGSLDTVTFNATVYKISVLAFGECTSLRSIKLPAGLTVLGSQVFSKCSNLSQIKISSGALLADVDVGAFYGASVQSFEVEDGNKYLSSENGVLYDRAKKRLIAYPYQSRYLSFKAPDSVKTIGKSAFSNVFILNQIDLNNVEYIETSAFANAKSYNYSSDMLNSGVKNTLEIVGDHAIKYIGSGAFLNARITSLPISNVTEYVGDSAFEGCTYLTGDSLDLTVSANLKYIGDYAFAGFVSQNKEVVKVPLKSVSFAASGIKSVGVGAFAYCADLDTVDLGKLEKLSDQMFKGCASLTSVRMPNTIKSIGRESFADCSALSSVSFSSGLTAIADGAFANTTALKSVVVPEKVTRIGASAFELSGLETITLNSVTDIGARAFASTMLTRVASSKIVNIGDGAFSDCSLLSTLDMPNLMTVGAAAFEKCVGLTSVTLPIASSIGDGAFADCTGLEAVTLAKVRTVGDKAFAGAVKLASVSLGKVESLGARVFENTAVTSVELPDTLDIVADGAFYGANKLESIAVDKNNKSFVAEDGVLYSVNDEDFYIMLSYPAAKSDKEYSVLDRTIKLSAYGFNENKNLERLVLSVYMQIIGVDAMSGMSKLRDITIYAVAAPTLESYSFEQVEVDDKGDPVLDMNGDPTVIYVNKYNNFNFAYGESAGDLKITVPANNTGYDNRIWKSYVGDCIVVSDKIHAELSMLDYIERIKALPSAPTAADAEEIDNLLRLYNLFSNAQIRFATGAYEYTEDGNSIDVQYYKKLFDGYNFYAKLKSAKDSLSSGKSLSSVASSIANGEIAGYVSDRNSVIWIVLGVVSFVISVFTVSVIICKKRSRK